MIGKTRKIQEEYAELNRKYMKVYGEKSELEYQLSMLKEDIEHTRKQDNEIRALHQRMRQLKHDMKNHLMVIASYINGEDYEEAKAYTSDILGKLNAMHSYIETGNSLMSHIINEKLELAKSGGIAVKAEIENLQFNNLASIDFSALLSNMLDNAIEASLQEENSNREIQVIISKQRGYETICVKNKINSSVLQVNPHLNSTKEEKNNHGMGIGNIRSIVEASNGMCDIYEEDNFFCVKVFIPA
ncbi:MAG: GHKL domain-containing protein [Lachnospiraceae bacterium]|nr:GHKL domain-containing protein [Lachnospiraceae bacterium]